MLSVVYLQDNVSCMEEIIKSIGFPREWAKKRVKIFEDQIGFIMTEFEFPFCILLHSNGKGILQDKEALAKSFKENPEIKLGILIYPDGKNLSFKVNDSSGNLDQVSDIFANFKSPLNVLLKKKDTKKLSQDLIPLPNNIDKLENLIFQLHSTIRDIDGFHADTALDEICKILYVKLYDEESTLNSYEYKLQRYKYSTLEECAAVVHYLYKEANEYDNRVYSLKIPGYKRSRGVFDSPIILSSNCIARIVELLQPYSFSNSDIDLKGRIFQSLVSPVLRGGLGQYFTPSVIVDLIVDLVKPSGKDLIMDPFVGSGHFLTSAIRYVRKYEEMSEKGFSEFLFNKLHGIEISDRMVRISMTDMRLNGDGHSNIRCVDSLLDFQNYQDLYPESFDIVMTNPPFGSTVINESIVKYKKFVLAKNKNNLPLEILGLERSIELLRPEGKLAIVLPDSIFVNSNLRYVRDWMITKLDIIALISLPIETFSPYGANIKTTILIGKKRRQEVSIDNSKRIFVGQLNNIGYDASGRTTKLNDIIYLKDEFDNFLIKERIKW